MNIRLVASGSLRRARPTVLVATAAIAAAFSWGGASVGDACAVDVSGSCGSVHAIFSGQDVHHVRTVTVSNTGHCDLRVRARKLGESQPEVFTVLPGGAAVRSGRFAEFTITCSHGSNPCKGTVTGF
jgi:hypothetical protein